MTRLIKSVLTLALLLGLSGIRLQAQPDTAYHPMRQQGPVPERMMLAPEVRAERQLQMLDHYRDLNRLQLYSYNLQRDQALQEAFLSGDILFGDTLSRYVAGIFARILAANAELSPKNRVFLTRYTVPNAVNWNEYTTFLNMGLLSRLASEAEVAYVLCHELAHQRLRHGLVQLQHQLHAQQRLARDARSLVAGKSRREVRNSLPMLQYTLEQKALRALLEAYRHSREAELQADSLGLALYRKTGYPAQAAATALARLETCDADAYPTRLDLHVALSTDEYSWPHDPTAYRPPAAGPDKEAALIDTLQQLGVPLTADSLATHPAIPLRLQQLNALLVGSVPDTTLSPVVDARHAGIVRWARYASAYTHYRHGDYGRSLYEVLQLARQQPGEPFLHALVVLNLMQLHHYCLLGTATYGRVVPAPQAQYTDAYNRYLHSLRLSTASQLAQAAHGYALHYAALYPGAEQLHFAAAWAQAQHQRSTQPIQAFKEKFPYSPYNEFTPIFAP